MTTVNNSNSTSGGRRPINRVLVANRGEIAVRVMRTLRSMGIASVAVYSDADAGARHVIEADAAVRIGPAAASESYLSVERIIEAAVQSGADAIHPGYGFLSENPALAQACDANGIVFVGPPVAAIQAMADKIDAKRTVSAAGVRVVPGRDVAGLDDDQLEAAALEIGLPVLLKPSAGGGGKGMRLVREPEELRAQITSARREARNAFGDDTILVERFITNPRHIEIQVLADTHGNVVHFGERECSLQRRHQKIVEEAPSPFLTEAVRAQMGAQAVDAARACGYVGAGTVEFIMPGDQPDQFFFMEMNTRLQVEHPVTEMVYGVDLVELQVRIAAGEVLPFAQHDIVPVGHSIEARVYAEDPSRDFLPTGGTVHRVVEAVGAGVRVDSSLIDGLVVGSNYDPMLAKVIAYGADRDEALRRLDAALAGTSVLGVGTNVGYLRRLLHHPDVRAGRLDTGLVERLGSAITDDPVPDAVVALAAVEPLLGRHASVDPWQANVGWRHGGAAPVERRLDVPGRDHRLTVTARYLGGTSFTVSIDEGDDITTTVVPRSEHRFDAAGIDATDIVITRAGVTSAMTLHRDGSTLWVGTEGSAWPIAERDPLGSASSEQAGSGGHGPVRSPMPGTVIAILVSADDAVAAGQVVAIVEAMKMEHSLRAAADGVVAAVHVRQGAAVKLDEAVLTIGPPAT